MDGFYGGEDTIPIAWGNEDEPAHLHHRSSSSDALALWAVLFHVHRVTRLGGQLHVTSTTLTSCASPRVS